MRPSSFILSLVSLLALPSTLAANGVLRTNAVSYCAENSAVDVEQFEIAYHQYNRSVTFSFSLQAVESNLNVSANLYLNAYGMDIVNQTIPLCTLFSGVICPLPTANFTGFGTYPIPSQYTDKIPGIAYTVPNLEAFAQIQLIRVDSGEVAACLQATLSNGKSTRQIGVAIGTGVFTLVALLVGLFHNGLVNSPSPAQYRWFDILYLFQSAAASGMLHLNYPTVYTNFSLNFAWAMGLFHSGDMQRTIDEMREKTGGHVQSNTGNVTIPINQESSPYNARSLVTLIERADLRTTVIEDDNTESNSGVSVYSTALRIPYRNALDTIFFFYLALIAIAIAFHVLLFLVVWFCDRRRSGNNWARRLRQTWWGFCAGNALRLCLIGFLPLWIFGFFQFRVGDSGLSIFFAVFGILLTLAPLVTIFVLSVIRSRRASSTSPTISRLYTSFRWFHSVGALYRPYRQRYHFFWFAPLVLAMIARAGFIAFGNTQAWAQVIGNIVVEAIVFVSLLAFRPHKDRKGDWLVSFLSFCRLCAFGLLIAFIPSVGVKPIPRTIIGFVIIVLFGVPTILLLLGFFFNIGYGYWWRRNTHKIEDGLEVDRFVASHDDGSQERMDMRQSVDANNFVSASGPYTGRYDDPQRSSVIEPMHNQGVEYRGEGFDNKPMNTVPPSPEHTSPTTLASPMDPYRQTSVHPNQPLGSAAAYHKAATGGGGQYGEREYLDESMASSRRNSRASEYQTPMSGNEYYTPTGMGAPTPRAGQRASGGEYFGGR